MGFSRAVARSLVAGLLLAAIAGSFPAGSRAADPPLTPAEAAMRRGSGLPVPRFAAMRSDDINVRSGPGTRYPIEWVFQRKYMPVEVIAEFDTWRKIRDWQGTTGWVHQSMLVGKRMVVVSARDAVLLRTPETDAQPVARVQASVVGEVLSCKGPWCRIRFDGQSGWMARNSIWGVFPDETIN